MSSGEEGTVKSDYLADWADMQYEKAQSYYRAGNLPLAEFLIKQIIRIIPSRQRYHLFLGQILRQKYLMKVSGRPQQDGSLLDRPVALKR